MLPGGDVGFAAGLRGEARKFRLFDVREIIDKGVAKTFAEDALRRNALTASPRFFGSAGALVSYGVSAEGPGSRRCATPSRPA